MNRAERRKNISKKREKWRKIIRDQWRERENSRDKRFISKWASCPRPCSCAACKRGLKARYDDTEEQTNEAWSGS